MLERAKFKKREHLSKIKDNLLVLGLVRLCIPPHLLYKLGEVCSQLVILSAWRT
uniref:Uncharacterized protein n=1 Tax=Arundo donax TaxID=35708 RepID=A0A0A8ZG31_ARUDO